MVSINETVLNSILQNPQKTLSLAIPNGTNNPTELELFRVEFTAPDFKVNSLDGNGNIIRSKSPEHMVFYHGIIKGSKKSLVALSFSKDKVSGLVSDSLDNYSIGKLKGSKSHFYCNSKFIDTNTAYAGCGTPDNVNINNNSINVSPITGCKVVSVTVQVDYDYFVQQDNNLIAAETSIRFIFNQTAAIYREDNMAIQMESLNVFESASLYSFITGNNNGDADLLNTYQTAFINQHGINGNVLYLFTGRDARVNANFTAGGSAYVGQICTALNASAGWSHASSSDNQTYPSFSVSVKHFAHELGHILGSPHTHQCAWNGNNTAIDNCVAPVGGCSLGPNPVNGGTIMSYCFYFPLSNGFGPQPGALIRGNINNRNCVSINHSPPINLSNNPMGTSATVQWTDYIGYNSSRYQLQYRKIGSSSWIALTTNGSIYLRADNYNITGLEINTNYEWRVQTECSDWAYSSFKTFPTFGDISINRYIYCPPDFLEISLPIDEIQYLPDNNYFNIELSNASGSFDSPTNIGSFQYYPGGGYGSYLLAEIPYNIPTGTKYRIRVFVGPTNTVNATINYSYDIAIGTSAPSVKAVTTCPDGPTIAWDVSYGGTSADIMRNICPTNDGGTILFGSSISPSNGGDLSVSDKSGRYIGGFDYWAVKIDENKNKAWDFSFGGSLNDFGTSVVPTKDGGFLIGGNTNSPKSGDISQDNIGNNLNDYWVVKISSNGQKLWDKRFGGTGDDYLITMLQTDDGGYLLAGNSNSPANGTKTHPSWYSTFDYWIIKIDANGNRVEDWVYGGGDTEQLASLTKLPDGGFLIGGSSISNATGDKTEPSWFNTYDYWIVKVDANFNKVWDKRYGGGDVDRLAGMVVAPDGNYVIAGYSSSNVTGDKTEPSRFNTIDYWVLKVANQDGHIIKQHRFGGGAADICTSILATNDDGFLLGGYSNSNVTGDKTEPCYFDSFDFWILKVDRNLEKKWDKDFRGGGVDIANSMVSTNDGMYLISGYSDSQSAGEHSQLSRGDYDYWTVKFSDCQTSNSTTVNIGQKAFLTANGCLGTITWSNGATTNNIVVSPTTNTTYTATCYYGCTSNSSTALSITVDPCPTTYTLTSPNDDYANSPIVLKAKATNGSLNATNKITGASNVIYEGKKITLNAGFETKQGTVFKAQIGGCN